MPRVSHALSALVVMVVSAAGAGAQEVKWRGDYAAARKEATASGKPLLLDFGTESCVWCRKQDATTFRNPAIVGRLNDSFIPMKIDAEKYESLTRALGVDSFPTLILATADGKVIGRQVGYADAAQLTALLEKAPPPSAAPKSPAAELLGLARGDHDAGRYLACLEQCDRLAAAHPNTPESAAAKQLAARIAADPVKWKAVREQIDADLTSLRPKLPGLP